MKTALASLTGISPYSQSRNYEHDVPKLPKESAGDYRERTWMHSLHVDAAGIVYVPSMALKNCVAECAKFLNLRIPDKGKATYTKHVEAGVIVPDHASLGIKASDVKSETLFLPSDGKRGSGSRVWKRYPVIPAGWTASALFIIGDDTVTREIFEQILSESGRFIGLGRFRPRNNGFYGRFQVDSVEWS